MPAINLVYSLQPEGLDKRKQPQKTETQKPGTILNHSIVLTGMHDKLGWI